MRLILTILFGFIALSFIVAISGPLIVLGIGAVLTYYSYKNLIKANHSILGMIWWLIVGTTGVSMFVSALPSFMFVVAFAILLYLIFRKSNSKPKSQLNVEINPNKSSVFSEYESFEAQWRDITSR